MSSRPYTIAACAVKIFNTDKREDQVLKDQASNYLFEIINESTSINKMWQTAVAHLKAGYGGLEIPGKCRKISKASWSIILEDVTYLQTIKNIHAASLRSLVGWCEEGQTVWYESDKPKS